MIQEFEKQYIELRNNREEVNDVNLYEIEMKILKKIYSFGIDINLVIKNFGKIKAIYLAPLRKVHGSDLVCWPLKEGEFEIYIDENYCNVKPEIAKSQISHEVLHSVSQFRRMEQSRFGYGGDRCIGIDEATTQMITDEINGKGLDEQEDYLYFIKNIMRVMKTSVGEKKLISQYMNLDNSFEEQFNTLTRGGFFKFSSLINELYYASREQRYNQKDNRVYIEEKKKEVLKFIYIHQLVTDENSKTIVRDLKKDPSTQAFIDYFTRRLGINISDDSEGPSLY